jgi:diguanylate cyclase
MADEMLGDMDVEYASTVADRAIRSMSQQSVPATPSNFSVWFNYAIGATPALRKTIDILIGNKRKFNASINHELYATYIDAQSDQVITGDFSEQLRGVIAGAKHFLATAISDNRTQIATLGEVSSQVRLNSDPRPIIVKLVTELTKSNGAGVSLGADFLKTAQELDKIRESLKAAEQRSNTDSLTGLATAARSRNSFVRLRLPQRRPARRSES